MLSQGTESASSVGLSSVYCPCRGYVRDLLRLVFLRSVPPEAQVAVLLGTYLDESGTHAGSDAITVAGYLASPERWEAFDTDWREMLDRFGLLSFHMKDFAHKKKQFKGWTEDRRQACYSEALSIINHRAHASFAYCVLRKSFEAIFPSKMKDSYVGPYGWAAYNCFGYAVDLAHQFYTDPWIAHVLDSGALGKGEICEAFEFNRHDPQTREMFRLHSLTFSSDDQVSPLQAADILAYELCREMPRQVGFLERKQREYPLKQLSSIPNKWQYDPDDILRGHVKNWERWL